MFWSSLERSRDLRPSEWAEAHRELTPEESAHPGPWRNENNPALVGMMDAGTWPGVEEIVFVKPTQVGGSEALRNINGHVVDCAPGPCLWVLPDEKSTKDAFDENLLPMIDRNPRLSRWKTPLRWDLKRGRLRMKRMTIWGAWSGSAAQLARRPIRYCFFDEMDKWAPWTGKESSPNKLAIERTKTYPGRKRIYKSSTPTLETGYIWQEWSTCELQFEFLVPCPECGEYQDLRFAQVKWPDEAGAKEIKNDRLAWYECRGCGQQIQDRDKPAMLQAGRWIHQDQRIEAEQLEEVEPDTPRIFAEDWGLREWVWNGRRYRLVGENKPAAKIGFHLNSLYSPWLTLSDVAAEFLNSRDVPELLQNFLNSWLAEPFRQQVSKAPAVQVLEGKAEAAPEAGVTPPWGEVLLATADVQKSDFWFVLRWWGPEKRSQLYDFGRCLKFEELRAATIGKGAAFLLIDSGGGETDDPGVSRTDEIYEFCKTDPDKILPAKGENVEKVGLPMRFSKIPYGQYGDHLTLRRVNTTYYKDRLSRIIRIPEGAPGHWGLNNAVTPEYYRQMTSEHKVAIRNRGERWVKISRGTPNHIWDCEILQLALADLALDTAVQDQVVSDWFSRQQRGA